MTRKLKILIADDHAIVRMGLSALIDTQPDMECVGEAIDGNDAIMKTKKHKPDIIVMDIMMPELDGIEATRTIAGQPNAPRILFLTSSTSSDELTRSIKAGAAGAIMKSEANAKLLEALRAIANGRETYLSEEVRALVASDPPTLPLTDRQIKILAAMAKGLTNKDIAAALDCSPESVKDRINAICTKLGAANRTEAVAIALRKQILRT